MNLGWRTFYVMKLLSKGPNWNIRVGIQVGTSFRKNKNLILASFFCNFWKIWNRTNSEYFVSSEYLETPVFDPKTGLLTQKGDFDPNLFLNFFVKFSWIQKTGVFRKISKLQKSNNSETRKNEKFGNFRLLQGLIKNQFFDTLICFNLKTKLHFNWNIFSLAYPYH